MLVNVASVYRRRLRRDSSLTTFARNDGPSRIVAFAEGHDGVGVITARGGVRIFVFIRHKRRFQFVLPLAVAEGGDVFGADSRDGLQHELREIAKGDGVFAGDASLGHEEKRLGEGAVDAGGCRELGAEGFEGRCVRYAPGAAFLLRSVMSAEFRWRRFALPSIGESKLAARSGRVKRGPSLRFVAQDADPSRIGEFVRRLVGGRF